MTKKHLEKSIKRYIMVTKHFLHCPKNCRDHFILAHYKTKRKIFCILTVVILITIPVSVIIYLIFIMNVAAIRRQLRDSTCFVYSDNVQYRWHTEDGKEKAVIPDASINCQTKKKRGNSFIGIPRFVMEVLSPSTEQYDRVEKMELYREQEIEEYWIVDWREKKVEIYELDYENEIPKYYLWKVITENNKQELKIIHFPNITITFDELFEEIEL